MRIGEQEILTPDWIHILGVLTDAKRAGKKIVSVCPFTTELNRDKDQVLSSTTTKYIVVLEATEESVRKEMQEQVRYNFRVLNEEVGG